MTVDIVTIYIFQIWIMWRKIGNVDATKIYGVMPYVAPEVLRGKPYTKSIYI